MDLYREMGDVARHFGAEQLGRGRGDAPVLAGHPFGRRIANQLARPASTPVLLIGDHGLHQLKAADRPAALE